MPHSPPFRAEHIGSLLRPRALLEAKKNHAAGSLSAEGLALAEDQAIGEAIALQQRAGLKLVTDGEYRRRSYHSFFFSQLGDIAIESDASTGAGGRGAQPVAVINSRIRWTKPIHVADFDYLKRHATALPKITIPGPCALHFRGGDAAVTAHAYTEVEEFWDDIVAAFRAELLALAAAGCTYVQIDETAFAKFGDPAVQAALAARGDDWSALIDRYIAITNRVLLGLPGSLKVGMHLCRGNRGGHWHAEGSYESVAERLFNNLAIDFFYLEFDSPRAGGFAPLRLLPRGKSVVLGLVSTKSDKMESMDALKQRIDEASRYVAIDRLAVSPQCGFASVDSGNPVTPQIQEQKLSLVVRLAEEVWGSA
jgi:5-methyltetrahydropteroyltriglutamate--homocysteine methyltransferase